MPDPDEESDHALTRLSDSLDAFDAGRVRQTKPFAVSTGAEDGYRLLGTLIGGVLGGLGLGWLADRIFGWAPFGLIGGLLIGTGMSVYAIVRLASRSGPSATKDGGVSACPPRDSDDGG